MSSLPVDVLTEILLKLPAKSLLRFKSVCKSWYDLINGSDFMSRHVEQSNMHIVFRNPVIYMCDFDTFDNPRNLNYPYRDWEDGGFYIVGSCRGLLCFTMHTYPFTTFLYNPTTQTYKTLPFLPLTSTFNYPKGIQYIGFGYDHLSEDYKCVRIDLCKCNDGLSFKSQVMVYSLRHDTWKRGVHDLPYYIDVPSFDFGYCVSLDGVAHWSMEDNNRHPLPILGFNLIDETFSSVALPNYHKEELHMRAHIGVLDSCLCLILNYWLYSDVWIMKEYGVVSSWTRMCRVVKRHHFDDMRPISFSKSKKELLLILTTTSAASLDLETLEITSVQLPGFSRLWGAYVCSENLLVFKDGEGIPMGKHLLRSRNSKMRRLIFRKAMRTLKSHDIDGMDLRADLGIDLRANLGASHSSIEES